MVEETERGQVREVGMSEDVHVHVRLVELQSNGFNISDDGGGSRLAAEELEAV